MSAALSWISRLPLEDQPDDGVVVVCTCGRPWGVCSCEPVRDLVPIPTLCPDATRVLITNGEWVRCVGCKKWPCPVCGAYKKAALRERLMLIKPTHMLTFTLPGAGRLNRENADILERVVRAIVNWIRHQPWGRGAVYGWTREEGDEHGQLHVHMLIRLRIHGKLSLSTLEHLRSLSLRNGGGAVNVKFVWPGKERWWVGYLVNYLTKRELAGWAWDGIRRFGMSPGFTLPKVEGWRLVTWRDCYEPDWKILRPNCWWGQRRLFDGGFDNPLLAHS